MQIARDDTKAQEAFFRLGTGPFSMLSQVPGGKGLFAPLLCPLLLLLHCYLRQIVPLCPVTTSLTMISDHI